MKKLHLILISFFTVIALQAQTNPIRCIQGIWKAYCEPPTQKSYVIRKGFKVISVNYSEPQTAIKPSVWELYAGFVNYNPNDSGKVALKDLREEGSYYVQLSPGEMDSDSVFWSDYFLTPHFWGCNKDDAQFYSGKNIFDYTRIEHLPSKAMRYLYQIGKKQGRDYISEYLNVSAVQVVVEKCKIYSSPDVLTNMYLIKGDVATVLEKKDDWLKIEFLGTKLVTGWIKASDVK